MLKKRMFYDSSLENKTSKRLKTLSFAQSGTYVKQGEKMRKA
jgi:hypothetical protein